MAQFRRNPSVAEPDDADRAKPAPASVIRPLTASAARIKLSDKDELDRFKKRKQSDTWQTDAWEYFDAIGEIKYSGNLIGAVLSRVRLYPAYNVDPDQAPAHVNDAANVDTVQLPEAFAHDADRVLRRLDSANGGLSGLLNRAGVNIWVAGECYLVQVPAKVGSDIPERWDIKSVDELDVSTNGVMSLKKTRTSTLTKDDALPDGAFAGRIWRSHPRYSDESDSSLRAVRDLADEVLLYGRTGKATARSRLNAGMLYVPDGLAVAQEPDEEDELDPQTQEVIEAVDDEDDSFEDELIEAMMTPVADEESAAAVVPLLVRGPAELGEKIKYFTFERSFDPALAERGEKVLERMLQGLDMPKDVISGLANVKYSNAIQIDEQLYKAHIEPLVLLICDALTAVYYRPALTAMGYDKTIVDKALVWYDPSEILTRPDRAQSANDGYDRRALGAAAWRKAHGYSETDAPTPAETVTRAVIERAALDPNLAAEVLRIFAPTLLGQARQDALAQNPGGPLSQQTTDILNGVPQSPTAGAPPNPAAQPPAAPAPPTPTPPAPVTPAPAVPTPTGLAQ